MVNKKHVSFDANHIDIYIRPSVTTHFSCIRLRVCAMMKQFLDMCDCVEIQKKDRWPIVGEKRFAYESTSIGVPAAASVIATSLSASTLGDVISAI